MKRKSYLLFWIIFFSPFVLLTGIFILIAAGKMGFMPSFDDLENPNKNIASEIISEDGKLLGTLYRENRSFVSYDDLSVYLIQALLATEDIRFYEHSGVDFRGLGRVMVKTIMLGSEESGGGSTITQQLAKNLFPRDTTYRQGIARKISLVLAKFKEWMTAVKLEHNYTKDEILTMYFNTVPFGSNAYGIRMAAKTYFNKTPKGLLIEEAAMLVGMLKAPTRYSPVLHPDHALARRNVVLKQMLRYNFISPAQYDSLSKLPVKLVYKIQDHNEGIATYFREHIRRMLTAPYPTRKAYVAYEDYVQDSLEWFTNPLYGWCNKNKKPDGTAYDVYSDGLKIYTTIHSVMQQYAEEAVTEHLRDYLQPAFYKEKKGMKNAPYASDLTPEQIQQLTELSIKRTERYRVLRNAGMKWDDILKNFRKKQRMTVFTWKGERDTVLSPLDSIRHYKYFLRAAFMAIDPHNAHVKAYVGGPLFKYFKYDQVKYGKRQVGSTIKPFIYTLAMQEGYSPCYKIANVPTTFFLGDTTWTPRNSGLKEYEGKLVTLKFGLANSVNYVSAWIMKQFNPPSVIDLMRKMGITSYLAPYPSLVLGTSDISLYEMTGAYATYANKGVYTRPVVVTKIVDRNGTVLYTHQPWQVEAISEQTAYLMLKMMEAVVNHGTAIRLRRIYDMQMPIAAKTGTTQNHSDGWFMGLTPDLVAGVWVGGEDRSIHFDNLAMGQGANMALPIWAIFMKKCYADKTLHLSQGEFEAPENFAYDIDCKEDRAPSDEEIDRMIE